MSDPFQVDDGNVITETRTERQVKRPRLHRVLIHNDDYTSREFVVEILRTVFHHDETTATRVMMHVHHNGRGVAGVFTLEVAETKVARVDSLARSFEFPLLLTVEPEEDES